MGAMASQTASLNISVVDHKKNQNSASLAIVRGIHRNWWIPRKNGQ